MSEKLHRVVGIDLGTTYSAVSTYDTDKGMAVIIQNKMGEINPNTTPSVVSLAPDTGKVIVGELAKRNISAGGQGARSTIIEIKREMGETFNEKTLEKYNMSEGQYKVGDALRVYFANGWRLPQEISAFILMRMKEVAEEHLGGEIYDAVITVPAYFTERQKKATEEAALLAGLYPRQLIPEPTAAAICYGLDRDEEEKKTYLVYDLGGGTFDVSIIQVEGEQVNVIATSGDARLGGGDFDDAITQWAADQLKQKYGIDVSEDPINLARIKERAEGAKIHLGLSQEFTLNLIFLKPQDPPQLQLTRETFEELIYPLLQKTLVCIDNAIKSAAEQKGVNREDIDAILLVGGSSKIPKVRSMLIDHFEKDEEFVRAEVNPDTVVARGAALMGLRFAPSSPPFDIRRKDENKLVNTDMEEQIKVRLITEHSLGVGIQGNLVQRIVQQGTNIPIEVKEKGFTNGGPVEFVEVPVYQGEGKYSYQNTLIGTLRLGPMEPRPRHEHQFEVIFSLDENGLLTMTVEHINENTSYRGTFEQKTGVGGDDALVTLRNMLLKMYGGGGEKGIVTNVPLAPEINSPLPPLQGYQPPPPYAVPLSHETPPSGVSPPPQTQQAPHTDQPTYQQPFPGQQGYQPPYPGQPQQSFPDQRAPSPGDVAQPETAIPGLIEPEVEVPEQFKQILRRSRKQLLKKFDQPLLDAFNAFAIAINSNELLENLEDLGDTLADTYDDARRNL